MTEGFPQGDYLVTDDDFYDALNHVILEGFNPAKCYDCSVINRDLLAHNISKKLAQAWHKD